MTAFKMFLFFLSTPVKIAPMNSGFIPPKIDGFGEDKKQINCVCVCIGFNSSERRLNLYFGKHLTQK